jgi:putative transposase
LTAWDNAAAESFHGIYKTELIRRRGPWRNAEHVELETLAYIE